MPFSSQYHHTLVNIFLPEYKKSIIEGHAILTGIVFEGPVDSESGAVDGVTVGVHHIVLVDDDGPQLLHSGSRDRDGEVRQIDALRL